MCTLGERSFCLAGEAAEEAFKRQFENDFDLFLRLRAREFAVNGLLFVVIPGSLGSSNVGEGFFTAFNDAAQAMCHEGHIDASLLADCMFPIYLPTEDVSASLPPCSQSTCCCWLCLVAYSAFLDQPCWRLFTRTDMVEELHRWAEELQ